MMVPPPVGRYRTLVIDPPWPVKASMPARAGYAPLPYVTLSVEAIASLTWCGGALPADPTGCHVYLWVTHRFLPDGLRCLVRWGVRYECVLTWVKNVGVTPYSEHVTSLVASGKKQSPQLQGAVAVGGIVALIWLIASSD